VRQYRIAETTLSVDYAAQIIDMSTSFHVGDHCRERIEWQQRYSYRFELEHLLEKAGFEIRDVWGGHNREGFGEESPRLVIVARKPADADMTVVRLMEAGVAVKL
jgi:hypothetical protein